MKIVLFKRKILTLLACAAAAALMFYVVNYPSVVGVYAADRPLPIYCVEKDYKVLSISFDAAWGDVRLRQVSSRFACMIIWPEKIVFRSLCLQRLRNHDLFHYASLSLFSQKINIYNMFLLEMRILPIGYHIFVRSSVTV